MPCVTIDQQRARVVLEPDCVGFQTPSCPRCNIEKSNMTVEEYRIWLVDKLGATLTFVIDGDMT